jgi:Mrp family chromosome partitioning ATPase/uncharacterized protein involved in exopolysaccharide biosynthesis
MSAPSRPGGDDMFVLESSEPAGTGSARRRALEPLFPAPTPGSSFTRRDFARIVFKHLTTILVCAVVVTAVVVAGLLMLPPGYKAEAKVLINTEQQGTPSFFSGVAAYRERNDADPVNRRMETEMELIETAAIAEEAVNALSLNFDQVHHPPLEHLLAPVSAVIGWVGYHALGIAPDPEARAHRATVTAMQRAITVAPMKSKSADSNSNIIAVSLQSPDPERARQALEIILTAYTKFDIRHNQQAGENALGIVDREYQTAVTERENIEERQRLFLIAHPEFNSRDAGVSAPGGQTVEPVIGILRRRAMEQEIELAQLRQTYHDRAPRVRDLIGSLTVMRARIAEESALEAASQIEYKMLQRELDKAEERTRELSGKRSQIALFLQMNKYQAGSRIVVEPPITPRDSGKKRKIMIGVAGCLVGLLLGLGLAGLFEYNDSRLQSKSDVRRHLALGMLAQLPHTSPAQVCAILDGTLPATSAGKARSLTPAIRDLGVQLSCRLLEPPDRGRTILVTSALEREGKSLVAVGIAAHFANLDGGRVLLVDGNSRNPTLHGVFHQEMNCGFARRLAGTPWAECVTKTSARGLDVLLGGDQAITIPLGSRDHVRQFLNEAAQQYTWTIIDGGACGRGRIDALPYEVDGVVLVVDSRGTRREVVHDTIDHLGLEPGRLLGVVLNQQQFPIPDSLYRWL